MRTVLLTAIAVAALTATTAYARCSKEDNDRALQRFQAYVQQHPEKRDQLVQIFNQVRNANGGTLNPERICDIVNQILLQADDHGR